MKKSETATAAATAIPPMLGIRRSLLPKSRGLEVRPNLAPTIMLTGTSRLLAAIAVSRANPTFAMSAM
jgi:hypothetical protein